MDEHTTQKIEVACIVLYTTQGKILLQHRTDDAPTDPSKWSLFGGRVEEGETPEAAVKRECYEELVYKLQSPRLVLTKELFARNYTFIEAYDKKQELNLQEGQGMRWFSYDELNDLDLADNVLDMLLAIQKHINSNSS